MLNWKTNLISLPSSFLFPITSILQNPTPRIHSTPSPNLIDYSLLFKNERNYPDIASVSIRKNLPNNQRLLVYFDNYIVVKQLQKVTRIQLFFWNSRRTVKTEEKKISIAILKILFYKYFSPKKFGG